jgi:hypothetical protein
MEPLTGTKLKILDAAIGLFSEKGFHEAFVRDIAQRTGIRVSSLYSQMSKRGLIRKGSPEAAHARLIESGASPHSELRTIHGSTFASVIDPFGNLLGVMGDPHSNRTDTRRHHAAEPIRTHITSDVLPTFLNERGFDLVDHLTAAEMETAFLTLRDGSFTGRVPSRFGLATSAVR